MDDNLFLFFIIIIPILLVLFSITVFSFYSELKLKRVIINTLSSTNSKIIDKNRTEHVSLKNSSWLTKKLKYAGFNMKGAEFSFILISIIFAFLVSFFIYFIAQSKVIFIFTCLIFSLFPYLFLVKLIKTREEEFNTNLKGMIDKVTSMMKSGVGFEQALKKSIFTCKSKLTQDVFNIYINEKAIIGEDKCFEKMFDIIESKELRIFYLTISIGRKSGGKFSNTLENTQKNSSRPR
ncbi:MAG: hypothetical protein U5K55_07355 [Aliarcobacter sp.]|nr:hypothetical protein [Aliarcobacter sp.]